MSFPFYLQLGGLRLHPHVVFESFAYFAAFRVYVWLRKGRGDAIDDASRWWVIAGAAVGAVLGSKLLYWFEDPGLTLANWKAPAFLMSGKTIVGALIGGLFAVEWTKRRIGVTQRTGDLFAIPLCIGIAIGRIGCFLSGLEDHTAGSATSLPWAVNFGDGVPRHPTQIYEIVFVLALAILLWRVSRQPFSDGDLFKIFMVGYFSFRLAIDFLKPDIRVFLSLSSIQWACVVMLLYYWPDVHRWCRAAVVTPASPGAARLSQPGETP